MSYYGATNAPASTLTAESLADGSADPSALDDIATTIIKNEVALRAYTAVMESLRASIMQMQTAPDDWAAHEKTYQRMWVEHNEHKFFAFLIEGLHARLVGKVKPAYADVMRANSPTVAGFLAKYKREDLLAAQQSGVIVGFGGFPVVFAISAAAFIVSVIAAAYAYGKKVEQHIVEVTNATAQAAIACEQADKCAPGTATVTINAAAAAAERAAKGSWLDDLSSLAKWGFIIFLGVTLAPPLLASLKKKGDAA